MPTPPEINSHNTRLPVVYSSGLVRVRALLRLLVRTDLSMSFILMIYILLLT